MIKVDSLTHGGKEVKRPHFTRALILDVTYTQIVLQHKFTYFASIHCEVIKLGFLLKADKYNLY